MWIRPLTFRSPERVVSLAQRDFLPIPPWSGVPVALEMEVADSVLTTLLEEEEAGVLEALLEDGTVVSFPAIVDPDGSHSCEADSVAVLIVCGAFSTSPAAMSRSELRFES